VQNSGQTIVDRVVGVLKLEVPTYEAIERDPHATREAAIVVAAVAIASGIGGLDEGLGGLIAGIIGALITWLVFSGFAYFFGKQLFGTPTTQANFEHVLRTVGYARAPGLLNLFGFIPVLGIIIAIVASIWGIVTVIIAIRQALDFSTSRAIITGIVAAIAAAIVLGILGLIFDIGAFVL
jgi:hypothetical protein